MKVTKAIIPIAGIGSRFLPATKAVAKELFPILNKPVLLYILEECLNSGIKDVFVVISPSKEYVKDFLKRDKTLEEKLEKQDKAKYLADFNNVRNKLNITFGYQTEPKGSGHALLAAENWVGNDPVAVLFGDDLNFTPKGKRPVIGQLIDVFEKYQKLVIGCKRVPLSQIHKYSAVVTKRKLNANCFEASGIVEKPTKEETPSNISGLARYILPPKAFEFIKSTSPSKNGEIGLTEAMDAILKKQGGHVCLFKSKRYDTGDKMGFAEAFVEYSLRDEEIGESFRKFLKKLTK